MAFERSFGAKWRPCPAFQHLSEHELELSMAGPLTDLAVEANELVQRASRATVPGVSSQVEETDYGSVTRVRVQTEQAARALGKVVGNYVTIDSPDLPLRDKGLQEDVSRGLARELVSMIRANFNGMDFWAIPDFTTLICGLGNWNATPDAIGPMVAGEVLVTRHVYSLTPPEKRGGLKSVAAFSPGVLGLTGVETAEIIAGVVARVRPHLVIVVDALAARSISRLGTTIQLSDTGIQPGSGVGNRRFGINRESMGVPVIAIGAPTVVHALTIIGDALDIVGRGQQMGTKVPGEEGPLAELGVAQSGLPPAVAQMLQPYFGTLIVTPKEVDVLVRELSHVLAGGINYALHPAIDEDEIYLYLQ